MMRHVSLFLLGLAVEATLFDEGVTGFAWNVASDAFELEALRLGWRS